LLQVLMTWLIIAAGYLIGCIPTAYIMGRLMGRGDIRALGDGNPGSKNAFHILGPKAGVTVFCIDAFKGAVAVLLAQVAHLSPGAVMLIGIAAIAGHVFPLMTGWRGGEGMACSIGILTVLVTGPMLILGPLTLLFLALRRNVDLALAVMFVPIAPLCLIMHKPSSLALYSITLPCITACVHFGRKYARRAGTAEQ
jgi:glycerol-3-phosphate acyltransferase PlsY